MTREIRNAKGHGGISRSYEADAYAVFENNRFSPLLHSMLIHLLHAGHLTFQWEN